MSVYNLERKEGPVTFDSAKPLVVEIGLGCYFWLALCTLLSGALYPALEVGTACQIPLTLSCDAGLLLGFAGCLAVAQSGGPSGHRALREPTALPAPSCCRFC